jgi:hypothetical protein
MKQWRDLPDEMTPFLDDESAERLLTCRMAPDDAPAGFSNVAVLLAAVAQPEPIKPSMERITIDSMAAAIAALPASPDFVAEPPAKALTKVKSRLSRARLIGAIAVAGVLGTTGLAYAGALPGSAQDFASHMFAKIGLSVPGDHGKGATISDIAKNTKGTGGTKGQTVCTAASGGNCQSGQQDQHGNQGCPSVPTSAPVLGSSSGPGPSCGPGNSAGGNGGGNGNSGGGGGGGGSSGGHGDPNHP